MSRKVKGSRKSMVDEEGHGKADYRAAVFSDKGGDKERPAELFRMDLISAMKMSDNEYVDREDYFEITDQWREEWQRPVQVPVNLSDVPVPIVEPVHLSLALHSSSFSLPRDKLLHFKADERFDTLSHHLTQQLLSEDASICKYDADEQDAAWLRLFNVKLVECSLQPLDMLTFERFFEAWEIESFQNMSKRQGGGGADEDDVVCDVCWTAEGEDGNEMIFCDRCDICVHQACYGVARIPDSAWLCRPCSLGLQPTCCLCNKKNGALKPTKSGTRWAHVNCAIWVPEVGFGDPDKMEPIINIAKIPENRWTLICSICKMSNGAAIQCAVGACKTAFHVTCAFESNLEMQELLSDDGADVSLKAFCRKHTLQVRGEAPNKGNQIVPEKGRSTQASREATRNALSSGLKQQPGAPGTGTGAKSSRSEEAEANFFSLTSGVSVVADRLKTPVSVAEWVFAYWKLKRRSLGNRPLLPAVRACAVDKERLPYVVDNPVLAALRRFIVLRQDLERARNLCYLLVRREKHKRSLLRTEAEIYDKLPEQEIATSWRRLFMDGDPMPAIGGSPTVNDLRLIFGLESVYQTIPGAINDKSSAEKDKEVLRQCRKKFKDSLKSVAPSTAASTSSASTAPKVNRVVSLDNQMDVDLETSPKSSTMNPKLNKIRLRLAKSPSARTATIVSPAKEEPTSSAIATIATKSPVKVKNPKLQKLKIRLPKSPLTRTTLFERIKDDFDLTSPDSVLTGKGRGGKKAATVKGAKTAPTPPGPAGGVTKKAPRGGAAAGASVKHRRIKVPTFMDEEEGNDGDGSTSTSTSDSDDSSSSSSASSSESETVEMNPRQMRNRRRAAAEEPSSDSSESSDSSSSAEESDDDGASSDDEEEKGSSSSSSQESSDSDFVKPLPRKRVRRG